MEAVLVAMSCFRYLCEEADIRCSAEDIPVQSLLPNYNTFMEFASVSNMMITGPSDKLVWMHRFRRTSVFWDLWVMLQVPLEGSTVFVNSLIFLGRSALQKRVMALLRRIELPTLGNTEVRDHTFTHLMLLDSSRLILVGWRTHLHCPGCVPLYYPT